MHAPNSKPLTAHNRHTT